MQSRFLAALDCRHYYLEVSTLAEIEAAADALPLEQKQELLRFLALRVNGDRKAQGATDLSQYAGTLRLSEDPLEWQQRVRGEWE